MKKLAILFILLILIFGCAKAPQEDLKDTVGEETDKTTPAVEVEEQVQQPAQEAEKTQTQTPTKGEVTETPETEESEEAEKTEEKEENTVVVKEQPELELTGELKELIDKANNKVKTFTFTYGKPPLNTEINTYNIQLKNSQGQEEYLIRVDLYEYQPTKIQDYWDTVYMNPSTKEAKIYCLDKTTCQSKEVDKTNATEIVDYEKYMVKTPYDWIKEIPTNAKKVGPETLDSKSVTKFEFVKDGLTNYMWIDNTYGLPMQIVIVNTDGTETKHMYKDMKINSGKDADFKTPF